MPISNYEFDERLMFEWHRVMELPNESRLNDGLSELETLCNVRF